LVSDEMTKTLATAVRRRRERERVRPLPKNWEMTARDPTPDLKAEQ
jgi:hypothetical protein